MNETNQVRTLPLGGGRRTTLKFDDATWRAIETVAARCGQRWTQWVRDQQAGNPGAPNLHAAIRSAAIDALLSPFEGAKDRGGESAPVLLEGCTVLNAQELDEELAEGHVEGKGADFVAFEVLAGLDRNNQPTIWIRSGLHKGMSAAITLPFTPDEVEAKRGAFA